jgi:hypothetical protein
MVVYDSSVLIDYLDGRAAAVDYVERHAADRAVTAPLALFEVYQGEVFNSGGTDLDAVDGALGWIEVVDETPALARAAAELQAALARGGTPLAARDAYVAGVAYGLDERLAVADADFEAAGVADEIAVDVLPERP